jgi:hypothetical protein
VRRELARFGAAGAIGDVVAAWPAAVGDAIAANAWPARIARDGTLHVHASSAAWAFELGQLESVLRERLRERLGEAVPPRLRFAVGNLPAPAEGFADEGVERPPAPSPDDLAEAARLTAGIEDEELRKTVQRAVATSLARGRSDHRV